MDWRRLLELTLFDQRGEYDFDLSGVNLSDEAAGAVGEAGPANVGNMPTLADFSSIAGVARDATAADGGGGSFWSKLFAGGKDVLGGVGDFAKAALPVAGIGATIAGALSARDAANNLNRQSKIVEQGSSAQLDASKQAAALAPRAAAEQPKIDAVADKVGPLADRAAGISPQIANVASRVRAGVTDPSIAFGQQQLERAASGQLDLATEAKFAEAEAAEKADMESYLGQSGQGNSSQRQELLGRITQKWQAARAEAIQNQESLGLKALEGGRAGGATETSILGAEGGSDALAASILSSQVRDYATGAGVIGTAGNVLTGAAADARGATAAAQAEEQQLEALIASLSKAVADMTARAA